MHRITSRSTTILLLGCSVASAAEFKAVTCQGDYPQHLQGVCAGDDSIFWCFTTKLVKTDPAGQILEQIDVASHHGDLCFHRGKVYVAVNLGKFNDARGNADSWVYVYDATDLSLLAKHKAPEVFYGAGGIACQDGRFMVVGGLPPGIEENYVYEYDSSFSFVKKHVLNSGYTLMGIQTAAFADGQWWFGGYGKPPSLLIADESLEHVRRFEFNGSVGMVPLVGGKFLIGRDRTSTNGHQGSLVPAETDERQGLKLLPSVNLPD